MPNKWYKKKRKQKKNPLKSADTSSFRNIIHFTLSRCTPVAHWMSVSVSATKKNTDREAPQYLLRIFQRLISEFNICTLNPRRVSPRQKQVSNKGNFLLICLQTKKKPQYNTIQKTSTQRSVDAFLVRNSPENSLWSLLSLWCGSILAALRFGFAHFPPFPKWQKQN